MAFCALIAAARAGVIAQAPVYAHEPLAYAHGPVAHAVHAAPVYAKVAHEDYDPNPQYSFAYDVQDGLTGDSKSQHETRNGDVVHGSYRYFTLHNHLFDSLTIQPDFSSSLIDADGHKRTVEYTADDHNGFNAVVHREPLVHKVAAVHAPVHYAAAPVVAKVHAPVAYAAPAHYAHASPLYHH